MSRGAELGGLDEIGSAEPVSLIPSSNAASLFNEAARLPDRAINPLGNLDGSSLRLAAPGGADAHVVHPSAILETCECCRLPAFAQAASASSKSSWTNARAIEAQMTGGERCSLIIGLLGPASLVPRDPRIPVEVKNVSAG